jgi:agmatinase
MTKLIGIPFDGNSSFLRGPALAPARIRLMETEGSANMFCEVGMEFVPGKDYLDMGDLVVTGLGPEALYSCIKQKIKEELHPDHKLICFGGDHSISFPVIEAYAQHVPGLNVLLLDAHADLYENFDNNPYSHASPFARLMEKNIINSLTQVGIRTLNTHQREQASRFGVNIVEMKDFGFDFVSELKSPLYISLDLDVLDPAFAPGVSHHEPGGMTTRELLRIIQSIPFSIAGADIVEYNPTRDLNNTTAMVAYKLFKELLYLMQKK